MFDIVLHVRDNLVVRVCFNQTFEYPNCLARVLQFFVDHVRRKKIGLGNQRVFGIRLDKSVISYNGSFWISCFIQAARHFKSRSRRDCEFRLL